MVLGIVLVQLYEKKALYLGRFPDLSQANEYGFKLMPDDRRYWKLVFAGKGYLMPARPGNTAPTSAYAPLISTPFFL
ncbi:MAG: hypothetical protein ACYTG7_24430 [Planctomycetota bacterium]|jgi:hypothetical protein